MKNVIDIYAEQFGLRAKEILNSLGGNAAVIIEQAQSSVNVEKVTETGPCADFMGTEIDAETAAQIAHWTIIREIKKRYFSKLTREAALTICNALPDAFGVFSVCEGIDELTYNNLTFAQTWNDAHPASSPIVINGSVYFDN